jgi:hypothetical protein
VKYEGKKLCKLVSKDILEDDEKKFVDLVIQSKYYCRKCGRTAREEESLCKPKRLPDEKA